MTQPMTVRFPASVAAGPAGPVPRKAIPVAIAAMPAYTIGALAPVPFVYAAAKLRSRRLWLIAAAYGVVWVEFWVLAGVSAGQDAANGLIHFLFFALACAATVHAFVLRESLPRRSRTHFGTVAQQEPKPPETALVSDPVQTMCAQVQAALASLKTSVTTHGDLFPHSCKELLVETIARMEQVVSFVARGGHADAELRSVHAIATDYLPTSINTYVRLPREYALSQRNPKGRTAGDELELELRLLRNQAKEMADTLHRLDALRLEEQSAFLQAKFGKSELDLS